MKNKVILHIGLHKTGTTALQSFFSLNKSHLAAQGLHYVTGSHVSTDLWEPTGNRDGAVRAWEDTRRIIDSGHNALVSNENLSTLLFDHPERIDEIRHYFGEADVTVVLYLRRQDVHLESLYLQIIRGSADTTPFGPDVMDQMVHPDYYDYERKVRFFDEQFGRDNVIVRLYDWNGFHGGTITHDFLHAIGMPWSESYTQPPRGTNLSIDARMKDLVLTANATLPQEGSQLREFKEVIDVVEKFHFMKREKKLLSLQERKDMLAKWKPTNDAVAQDRFGSEELFDDSDIEAMGEPLTISAQDTYHLMFQLNAAWMKGMGAVPFPVYNYAKYRHLQRKQAEASGAKKRVLTLRIGLHSLLHTLRRTLIPRWPAGRLEKTAMRAIWKNAMLWLGKPESMVKTRLDE